MTVPETILENPEIDHANKEAVVASISGLLLAESDGYDYAAQADYFYRAEAYHILQANSSQLIEPSEQAWTRLHQVVGLAASQTNNPNLFTHCIDAISDPADKWELYTLDVLYGEGVIRVASLIELGEARAEAIDDNNFSALRRIQSAALEVDESALSEQEHKEYRREIGNLTVLLAERGQASALMSTGKRKRSLVEDAWSEIDPADIKTLLNNGNNVAARECYEELIGLYGTVGHSLFKAAALSSRLGSLQAAMYMAKGDRIREADLAETEAELEGYKIDGQLTDSQALTGASGADAAKAHLAIIADFRAELELIKALPWSRARFTKVIDLAARQQRDAAAEISLGAVLQRQLLQLWVMTSITSDLDDTRRHEIYSALMSLQVPGIKIDDLEATQTPLRQRCYVQGPRIYRAHAATPDILGGSDS